MEASSRSLYTFSFKGVSLFLLLLVILTFIVFLYRPGLGSDARYVFALNELEERNLNEEYQIAFFGNSYNYTSLDPSLIKSRLGLNAIHLNSSAQNIRVSLIAAKQALLENNLKFVFFEISGSSLRKPSPENEKHWFFQAKALQEIAFSYEKLKYTWDYFPKNRYSKYYISGMSRYLSGLSNLNNWKEYKLYTKRGYSPDGKTLFSHNGFIGKKVKSIEKSVFDEKFNGEIYKEKTEALWTKDLIDQMNDFISFAESRGAQVVLTYGLKVYPSYMKMDIINSFTALHKNLKFLDLNVDRDKYVIDEESFYDEAHYNYPVSYQVTNRLIDSISKWYKLPFVEKTKIDFKMHELSDFFYSLDETQDKFFRIEYDQLPPSELEEHTFVVGFYPKDTTVLNRAARERNGISEDHYFDLSKDYIAIGNKKVIVKKFDSKVSINNLDKIKMYFYKSKDTLKLPSFTIKPNDKKKQ
tara:strand:- start:1946 stop:3352 length:1407 start_codon:yes stop_codon:yes gene_type:complete